MDTIEHRLMYRSDLLYDADNRITNSGFEYGNDGNLTKAVIKGVQYLYVYDAEDRLITINDISGNKIASYSYDAEGNRSTKTTYSNNNPVNTTTYHYYNGELLYETLNTDPANVIHALYIRTSAGALEAVSLNYVVDSSSNTFYYYHYNAHDDVKAVTKTDSSEPTNITGKIYRQYTYDPYGNIISAKDGSGNAIDINNDSGFDDSYLYAGYRYDKESGLYFLNARYYAPGLGRFLTKDSEIDTANTESLNLYIYTQGDPVNLTDSDGNRPVVSDDCGELVLGYSPTEGHYHKSSTSVYSRSTTGTTKAIKKKTAENSPKSVSKKERVPFDRQGTLISSAVSGIEYGQIIPYKYDGGTFTASLFDLDTTGIVRTLGNNICGAQLVFSFAYNSSTYQPAEAAAMDTVDVGALIGSALATSFIIGTGGGGLLVIGAGLCVYAIGLGVKRIIDNEFKKSY